MPAQRPVKSGPISGKRSSARSERATRARVSAGSSWVTISCWRSSTAAALSSTRATRLELVECDRVAAARLLGAEARAFVGARDGVEQRDDVARIGVGVVERGAQERARQRPLVDVRAFGEAGQLGRSLRVER